jgi:hypothetical protein
MVDRVINMIFSNKYLSQKCAAKYYKLGITIVEDSRLSAYAIIIQTTPPKSRIILTTLYAQTVILNKFK